MKQFDVDEDMGDDIADLIESLLKEDWAPAGVEVPEDPQGRWRLFRDLVVTRPPLKADPSFTDDQDDLLYQVNRAAGITNARKLAPLETIGQGGISVWRGNITGLRVDGIVNPSTPDLIGNRDPVLDTVDSDIFTFAGVQLRAYIDHMLKHPAENQGAVIASFGYSLPCAFVFTLASPQPVRDVAAEKDYAALGACYDEVLKLAEIHDVRRLSLPPLACATAGYDPSRAAGVAVERVRIFLEGSHRLQSIFFVVANDAEEECYLRALR